MAVRCALDSLFVFLNIGHLFANQLGVNVRRSALFIQAFHELSVFNVDSFCLTLFVDKIERTLLV